MLGNLIFSLFFSLFSVNAELETEASPYIGDSVDDIAVWVHPDDSDRSLILATLKASNVSPVLPTGILVYDLQGKQLQFFKGGTPNNIDLRADFPVKGKPMQIIAASHWFSSKVGLYRVDPKTLEISLIGKRHDSGVNHARGLCMYHDKSKQAYYYFVAGDNGEMEQYQILSKLDSGEEPDEITVKKVRSFKLSSTTEGCVVDDDSHRLFIAEESKGIWVMDARPEANTKRQLIDKIRLFGPLKRDIEGLTLSSGEDGYLIASVQGRSQFAAYDKKTYRHISNFTISSEAGTDRVRGTDGIMIYDQPLTDRFPGGIFISQDETNISDGITVNQNFKITAWPSIKKQLDAKKRRMEAP